VKPSPDAYEKLGTFYLGREYDLDSGSMKDDLLLYDSKDLPTHAMCVGMTGSGKTGLCLSLLEEAAIDGIAEFVANSADADQTARDIVDTACAEDGSDNVTAVVVRCPSG